MGAPPPVPSRPRRSTPSASSFSGRLVGGGVSWSCFASSLPFCGRGSARVVFSPRNFAARFLINYKAVLLLGCLYHKFVRTLQKLHMILASLAFSKKLELNLKYSALENTKVLVINYHGRPFQRNFLICYQEYLITSMQIGWVLFLLLKEEVAKRLRTLSMKEYTKQ